MEHITIALNYIFAKTTFMRPFRSNALTHFSFEFLKSYFTFIKGKSRFCTFSCIYLHIHVYMIRVFLWKREFLEKQRLWERNQLE